MCTPDNRPECCFDCPGGCDATRTLIVVHHEQEVHGPTISVLLSNHHLRPTAGMRAAIRSRACQSPTQQRWVATKPTSSGAGKTTYLPADAINKKPKSPFYFDPGYALFAKRPSPPFPPSFLSPPSESLSDPLSTHNRSRDRRSYVNGEIIRGATNGDDAVLVAENFIGANDGVGAWASREKGHAA